jgi:hypothetical protein
MGLYSCYICKSKKDSTEFYKDSSRSQGIQSKCKECCNIIRKESKKKRMINDSEYRKLDNQKKEIKRQNREKIDPLFRLKRRTRNLIRNSFRKQGYSKMSKTNSILGISFEEFKVYFESRFVGGMSWDNMGKWHIDHIIPLSSANSEDELIKLCHYTNLQPLWEKDNLSKGDKIL